jgi:hypothetical protein
MGGAACWQFGVHYPTMWAACAPGAGFAETPEFLNNFQNEKVKPTWYEEKLWRMYNATDYAENLFNLPTVAYSGEIDRQKQAADVMAREMKKHGLELTHIFGPKTGHTYEKGAKEEVNRRIDAIVEKEKARYPSQFRFTTYTLRYDRFAWVIVESLGKHWERARVEVEVKDDMPNLKTENVTALRMFNYGDGVTQWKGKIVIDGTELPTVEDEAVKKFYRYRKVGGKWQVAPLIEKATGLKKMHGLQGPIDDAFMDKFMMVAPSGKPMNERVGKWVDSEMKHAADHWRKQFRGDVPMKMDTEVTDADLRNTNLILWGDPSSNALLAKIAPNLPVQWTAAGVVVGGVTYPAGTHIPVLVYPNPFHKRDPTGIPSRQGYVVLNSGFTFREYDQLNNARQVPKLPDYAVIDITTPPNSRYPGKIVRAGLFGEKWEILPDDGK